MIKASVGEDQANKVERQHLWFDEGCGGCDDGSCPQCDQNKLQKIRCGNWFGIACAIMLLCHPACGQATGSGPGLYSGPATFGGSTGEAPKFYAALPLNYVDNTICNPPSGTYDTTVILGTSTNVGPNCHNGTPPACNVTYTDDIPGFVDAADNWRDNADNQASATAHFADKWWLIEVPNETTGTVFSSTSYDANTAIISLPGKLATPGGAEPSKCLVIDSTTPLPAYNVPGSVGSGTFTAGEQVKQSTSGAQATLMNTSSFGSFTNMQLGPIYGYSSQTNMYTWAGQTSGAIFTPASTPSPFMACGRGLPGFGGARNPGCASPNDKASMWKVQLPAPQTSNHIGIYAGADLNTSANWVNHIVLRDVEVTLAPGAAQSHNGVTPPRLVYVQPNPLNRTPCIGCQAADHIGLERYYIHGNDPGDIGQPTTGSSGDSAANCTAWDNSGTVNVTNNGSTATVAFASGSYFGMTFTSGSLIYLGGTREHSVFRHGVHHRGL
jgi:hypothetical protein